MIKFSNRELSSIFFYFIKCSLAGFI